MKANSTLSPWVLERRKAPISTNSSVTWRYYWRRRAHVEHLDMRMVTCLKRILHAVNIFMLPKITMSTKSTRSKGYLTNTAKIPDISHTRHMSPYHFHLLFFVGRRGWNEPHA